MIDLLTPGQVEHTVFSLAESPTATPTINAIYKSSGGTFAAATITPTPVVVNVDGLRYYAGWTVPADAVTGDKFWIALDVDDRDLWVPGGMVNLRGTTPPSVLEGMMQ